MLKLVLYNIHYVTVEDSSFNNWLILQEEVTQQRDFDNLIIFFKGFLQTFRITYQMCLILTIKSFKVLNSR